MYKNPHIDSVERNGVGIYDSGLWHGKHLQAYVDL